MGHCTQVNTSAVTTLGRLPLAVKIRTIDLNCNYIIRHACVIVEDEVSIICSRISSLRRGAAGVSKNQKNCVFLQLLENQTWAVILM